jgi:hypothetical protein
MLDKFNFYDFLGYLLPGATVVLTIYWIGKWAFGVPFPEWQTDLGSSFLFLGVSYVAGHIVQDLGHMYEKWLNRPPPYRKLSERLLHADKETDGLDDELRLVPGLRTEIISTAAKVFKVPEDDHAAIFELCYALVIQKGLGQSTDVYLALNGLARGLLVATVVAFAAGAALVLKQLAIIWGLAPTTGPWRPSWQEFESGIAIMIALIPIWFLLRREFDRYRAYFAKSVYYNFLAWSHSQDKPAK